MLLAQRLALACRPEREQTWQPRSWMQHEAWLMLVQRLVLARRREREQAQQLGRWIRENRPLR